MEGLLFVKISSIMFYQHLNSAQVLIVFRSMFSECAAPLGDSTTMYKLVLSVNKRIEQPRFLTMSFI